MSDTRKTILEVRDLKVRAGERQILDGLSLTVRAGEVHAIMGPNGSGKHADRRPRRPPRIRGRLRQRRLPRP